MVITGLHLLPLLLVVAFVIYLWWCCSAYLDPVKRVKLMKFKYVHAIIILLAFTQVVFKPIKFVSQPKAEFVQARESFDNKVYTTDATFVEGSEQSFNVKDAYVQTTKQFNELGDEDAK